MTITAPAFKSPAHEAADRKDQRDAERQLDRELARDAPDHGRLWREHDRGIHGRCATCGRLGRRWIGTYLVYRADFGVVLPRPPPGCAVPPYAIHSSDPLCVFHVIRMQRDEWRIPVWRPSWVHERVGHA